MNEDYFEQESFQTSKIILKNVFGDDAKNMHLKKMSLRPRSIVFFVIINKQITHALKLTKFTGYAVGSSFCFNKWKAAGVPVIQLVSSGTVGEYDYTLTDYIENPEGNLLDIQEPKRLILAYDMGINLEKMHKCYTEGYGFINKTGHGNDETWGIFLEKRFMEPIQILIETQHLDPDYLVKTQKIIKEFSKSTFIPAYLHTDYYAHNVFANDDGTLKSVADPNPIIGDPLLDLAYASYINDLFAGVAAKTSENTEIVLTLFKKEYHELIRGYEDNRKRKLSEVELNQILKYKFLIYGHKYYWYSINNDKSFVKIIKKFFHSSYKKI